MARQEHQLLFIPSSPLQPSNFVQDTACTTLLRGPKLGKLPLSSSSAKWVDHTLASQDDRQGGASSVSFAILPPELSTEWSSPVAQIVKNPPANAGDLSDMGSIPESEDPLQEEMATHSSILAWRIP